MTPEDKDKITDDILSAFDEMAEEGAEEGGVGEPEPEEGAPEEEPEEQPAEDEPAEEEEPEDVEVRAEGDPGDEQPEEPEEEKEEPEDGEPVHEPEYPPDVQAYLDRHDGDLTKALKTMVEAQSMLQRRNAEYQEMSRRNTELEAQLAQANAFQGNMGLTPEQAEWISQAVESEQVPAYVQSAVQAGEFDLARALCDAWGQDGDAYSALRTRQAVDEAEYASQAQQMASAPPAEFSRDELFGMIQQQVPDFGDYYGDMTEIVTQLGPNHPMVVAAKADDPNEAALGLIDLYQVARTRRARVAEAKQQVQDETRNREVAKRQQARVSSASSRTSTEEPPQSIRIAPGLTLEELDAALAAE